MGKLVSLQSGPKALGFSPFQPIITFEGLGTKRTSLYRDVDGFTCLTDGDFDDERGGVSSERVALLTGSRIASAA
ncbi:MAG: hypothetical protein AAF550_14115 [Myxococcota bacterium]